MTTARDNQDAINRWSSPEGLAELSDESDWLRGISRLGRERYSQLVKLTGLRQEYIRRILKESCGRP